MTDRAVSIALGYTLTLAIAGLLTAGLLIAGTGFVEDTREEVVRQELEVVGQHLAGNVEAADRLVEAGDGTPTVAVNETFPRRVSGASYRVELVTADGGTLHLNATDPDVSVTVEIENTTAVGESTANGGEVVVVYDESADELVIRNG